MADTQGQSAFARASRAISQSMGHPVAFALSVVIVLLWGVSGPLFHFSDTWQLVINTGTTIVTFLMVFLIQNTQNRDATAMHLKLDELIRATEGARNVSLDMEELSETELNALRERYQRLASMARDRAERELITGAPDIEQVADHIEDANDAEASAETAEAVAQVNDRHP